jgi:two-component system, OmpR family, alkaline phosphatase synthesis response regulator PhoP
MEEVMENKPKLLLVDDEPDLVQMVSLRLKAAGYEVTTALDGQQALDKVKESRPDLMILDLMLPKLDGYKVCRLLKFDERTKEIPILIFTARAQEQDVKLATECGADAYLTKPFEAKTLLGKLQELLAAKGT